MGMNKILKIFSALSDETRLRIYLLLSNGELCVCELVNILDIEQSRISHGLRILKEAGLLTGKRKGTWVIYSVDSEMNKSDVIKGLIKEIKVSGKDTKNRLKCKEEKIRQKCGSKK